jgi:hypothetical protein
MLCQERNCSIFTGVLSLSDVRFIGLTAGYKAISVKGGLLFALMAR